MLTSKTYETLLSEYNLQWEKTSGCEFDKALTLLSDFCGYDKWLASLLGRDTHQTIVEEIIALYCGDEGYLKIHRNTLACDIGFLLFQITLRIPKDFIDWQDELAIIFQVITDKTGVNPYKFYQDTPLLHAFHSRNSDFNQTIVNYLSWGDFILKNAADFPPEMAMGESGYAHPINPESLSLVIKHSFDGPQVQGTFKDKISPNTNEISFLLQCDFSARWMHDKYADQFNNSVAKLSSTSLDILIDDALKKGKYAVVFYLYCHAYKFSSICTYSKLDYEFHQFNPLMENIFEVIDKPIDSPILLKIINSGVKIKFYDIERQNSKSPYYFLCSKHQLINNFEAVEAAYTKACQPDINKFYIQALFSNDIRIIEALLISNRLNLREKNTFSYVVSGPAYPNLYCGFRVPDKYKNFKCLPNNGVTFTPLQAAILVASEAKDCDLSFIFEAIKLFIKHDPACLLQLDSMGNSVDYYLKKLQTTINQKNAILINQISELIQGELYRNKMLTFIWIWHSELAYIPMDVITIVCMLAKPSNEKTAYDEIRSISCTDKVQYLRFIPRLNKDELVLIFELFIQLREYDNAVYLFCYANNIPYDSDTKIDNCISVLSTIYQLINKPVSAVWILKLFDDIHSEKSLPWKENHVHYLELCNKRHLIINWEAIDKRFCTYFGLDINTAILTELALLNLTKPEHNMTHLLERKKQQINSSDALLKRKGIITPLQELLLMAKMNSHISDFIETLEKLILYDNTLISELDSHNHNIYHYFTPLKSKPTFTTEYRAKVDHISVLIEQEHHRIYQCHQRQVFFKKQEINALLPVADDLLCSAQSMG